MSGCLFYLFAVLFSAVLYRWPRGGGPVDCGSFIGSFVWAFGTSVAITWSSGNLWALVLLLPLMLGEAPGWSRWWPNRLDGGSLTMLSLRGCLLLNPLMGVFYFGFFKVRARLPTVGLFLDGWTAYAELASGFVTALSYAALWVVLSPHIGF